MKLNAIFWKAKHYHSTMNKCWPNGAQEVQIKTKAIQAKAIQAKAIIIVKLQEVKSNFNSWDTNKYILQYQEIKNCVIAIKLIVDF